MGVDLSTRQCMDILEILAERRREGTARREQILRRGSARNFVTGGFALVKRRAEDSVAYHTHSKNHVNNSVQPASKLLAAKPGDMALTDFSTGPDFDSYDENDLKKMLAELDRTRPLPQNVAPESDNGHNDVKKMLAELNKQIPSIAQANISDDPKMMLEDINRQARFSDQKVVEQDDDNDLEILRRELATMLSPLPNELAQVPGLGGNKAHDSNTNATSCEADLDNDNETKHETPGMLEKETNTAQQRQDMMTQRVHAKWEAAMEQFIQEDRVYRQSKERERQLRRLIVSNLAADANEDDIWLFFHRLKFDARRIHFIGERHPIQGTRIAQVDMPTRTSAVHASYIVGNIFGLGLHIKLAVENAN